MQNDPQTPADMPRPEDADALEASLKRGELVRPAGVFVIAGVVGLEALALAVFGIWSIFSLLTQPSNSFASAIFLTLLLLGLSAGLGAVAFKAFHGFRWTRSAAFVWQLLMVAIATPALLEGELMLGLLLLLPPLAVVYFLFTPKVVAFSLRTAAEETIL
ncbi:hypothetical protein [Arthrobacter sp. lap29]|uniref:hypothetical protein n=1 Tax=Arthrobacter sp. lap29 TaxID=3056122 RepID=UPI0028F71C13|nr:hypothetical protein [Arthrobacter sp. lap29]